MGTPSQTPDPLVVLVLDDRDSRRDPAVAAIAAALRAAAPGARLVLTSRQAFASLTAPPSPDLTDLSVREREVLAGLVAGLTNREIGVQLHLSADAIKKHVSAILRKLGARNRTEAARLTAGASTGRAAGRGALPSLGNG